MHDVNAAGFFVSAFATCLLVILFTLLRRQRRKPQNRMFLLLTVDILLSAFFMMVRAFEGYHGTPSADSIVLIEKSRYLYFVTHTALAPLFCAYILMVIGAADRLNWPKRLALAAPFIVTELMVLTNPLHHFVYYVKPDGDHVRGMGEMFVYAAAAFYMAAGILQLLIHWYAMTVKRRIAIFYFVTLTVLGILIQLLFPNIRIELLAEAVGLAGLLLSVENEDDRIDATTEVYNRNALILDLDEIFRKGMKRYALCIRLRLREPYLLLEGVSASNALLEAVSDFLKENEVWYRIYRVTPNGFMILSMDEGLLEVVEKRMKEPFALGSTEVRPEYRLVYAAVPDEMSSTGEVLLMGDAALPPAEEGILVSGERLKILLRRAEAEEALHRGLQEHSFEVFYQPVHEGRGEKLYAAEALIRLHDSVLGELYPDEFIPVAEQNGIINEIGAFVVQEVCRFLQSGVPEKLGMDHINVNLSVVQCMQEDFVLKLKEIIGHYRIRPSMLNFEITESVAARDYAILERVIREFKENGFKFSMDDYGTGYSNMHSVFCLDFDVIKIDKSILWEAEKSERGRIILENSVRMIRVLKKQILVEGVETREQVELLKKLGVDYFQGYYYSRPVSRPDFVKLYQERSEA